MNPSTRRTLFFLAIVAMVLIVLFAVTATHRPRSGGCATSDLATWRARVLSPASVAPGQLSGCTTALRQTFTIPGRCTLRVAGADARSRRLVISVAEPLTLAFTMAADRRSLESRRIEMTADVGPDKTRELSIGQAGQSITLTCKTSSSCHARLE